MRREKYEYYTDQCTDSNFLYTSNYLLTGVILVFKDQCRLIPRQGVVTSEPAHHGEIP